MNPRIEWLAREVLPVLFGLACVRKATADDATAACEAARQEAIRLQRRDQEARESYRDMRQLLLGCGFSDAELDQLEKGPAAPCECDPLSDATVKGVPL